MEAAPAEDFRPTSKRAQALGEIMDRDEFIPVGSGFEDARASNLMTAPVAAILATENLADAAKRMRESDCGSLPVVDEQGRPIGMITDRDIALHIAPRGLNAKRVLVRECMTENVVSCELDDHADRCLRLMATNQVRRLPVVNAEGILTGIISQADLARHAEHHAGRGERRSVAAMVCAISEPWAE
jgi:CBS domain-containing protein